MTWRVSSIGIVSGALLLVALVQPVRATSDDSLPTPTPKDDLGMWVARTPTPTPIPLDLAEPAGDPSVPAPSQLPVAPSQPSVLPPWGVGPPSPTVGPLQRAVIVRVCLDANRNRWCDADEGIAGMQVVIQDGDTGLVRATSLTDHTGTAQRTVLVRADNVLTVNIPYLGRFHSFTGDRQPEPVLVEQVPPLPGLLP